MAADKDKGIVDAAQNTVRETTGALRGKGPWYSMGSNVCHNNPNCQTGNSIEPENIRQGTGNKQLCGGGSAAQQRGRSGRQPQWSLGYGRLVPTRGPGSFFRLQPFFDLPVRGLTKMCHPADVLAPAGVLGYGVVLADAAPESAAVPVRRRGFDSRRPL
jgi:hypothetical protein